MSERAEQSSAPLNGVTVLVPRAKKQAGGMAKQLEKLGATVVCVPTIAFVPPEDPTPMNQALGRLGKGEYAWTVFTSTNAVDAFVASAGSPEQALRLLAHTSVASVGVKTSQYLATLGVEVDLMPELDQQNAAGLVAVFPHYQADAGGPQDVFLPRADIATDVLPDGLVAAGWNADHVTAYHTVRAPQPSEDICELITGGGIDAICFTSGSTVRNLISMVGAPPAASTVIACIGPMAAEQARKSGLNVHVVPQHAHARDLVEALADYWVSA